QQHPHPAEVEEHIHPQTVLRVEPQISQKGEKTEPRIARITRIRQEDKTSKVPADLDWFYPCHPCYPWFTSSAFPLRESAKSAVYCFSERRRGAVLLGRLQAGVEDALGFERDVAPTRIDLSAERELGKRADHVGFLRRRMAAGVFGGADRPLAVFRIEVA